MFLYYFHSLSSSSPTHTPKDSVSLSDVKAIVSGHDGLADGCTWEDKLCEQQEQLEREMQEARKMVSSLQSYFVYLYYIYMQRELLRFKQEARNLQGVKDALQQRMAVQESSVLQLKQELLRTSMAKDELAGQNAELQRKLEERNRLLSEYKKELGQKDRLLQQQQLKLDETLRKLTDSSSQQLPGSQNNGYSHPPVTASKPHHGELQLVRDALRSLRNSFGGHDPQHHTLDTLKQGVASKSPGHKASHSDRDSWPPTSKMAHSQSSPALNSSACTKVLYFTDRSLTPFMVNIPKRLGEVTLRDFKTAVDREGNYRYHFKALDPEFGTVKEEVFQDDAVVPGWEGKIVAWVEEDNGMNLKGRGGSS
uniref:DIX domain containing 1b n=1 Tax=Cyprinus carpio TaxID=7962 RepID=A0A8C2JFR0_CYPCA